MHNFSFSMSKSRGFNIYPAHLSSYEARLLRLFFRK
jgi:hypothetical protein